MTFANWPESVHDSPDQVKRLTTAKSSKTTPVSVDAALGTGIFPGSGTKPYTATLESCTCGDFIRRRQPCKHIYRLAIELGLLEEKAAAGVNKNILLASQIPFEKAVAILEDLSEEAQQIIEKFIYETTYHNKKVDIPIAAYEASDELLNCALVEFVDDPATALHAMKKAEILEVLAAHNVTGFRKSMNLKNLALWCVENIPDLWGVFPQCYTFRLSELFQTARHRTYRYLLRKFEWELFYDKNFRKIQYPYGAKFEGLAITVSQGGVATLDEDSALDRDSCICYFPDDEITCLLTKYGHNRCLDGFDISSQLNCPSPTEGKD